MKGLIAKKKLTPLAKKVILKNWKKGKDNVRYENTKEGSETR